MIHDVRELVGRIYDLFDENSEMLTERIEYCEPGADMDSLVRWLLPETAREVMLQAAPADIDECAWLPSRPMPESVGASLVMPLPPTFLRLLYLRMEGWPYGLSEFITPGRESWQLRAVPLRGRRSRGPAAAVRKVGEKSVLEIFGAQSGARVMECAYLTAPEISGNGIDFPASLQLPVCRAVAAKVKDILNI